MHAQANISLILFSATPKKSNTPPEQIIHNEQSYPQFRRHLNGSYLRVITPRWLRNYNNCISRDSQRLPSTITKYQPAWMNSAFLRNKALRFCVARSGTASSAIGRVTRPRSGHAKPKCEARRGSFARLFRGVNKLGTMQKADTPCFVEAAWLTAGNGEARHGAFRDSLLRKTAKRETRAS